MRKREPFIGACALALIAVFVVGAFAGWWDVPAGWRVPAGPTPQTTLTTPAPAATPTPAGELLSDGQRRIAGAVLSSRTSMAADLYLEAGISEGDAERIARTVDTDALEVQRTYGRRFASRLPVYVFASTNTFLAGLRVIAGREPTVASAEAVAKAIVSRGAVVNWELASQEDPLTVFRHELTHLMFNQIAKPTAANSVPGWLHEGSAMLNEFTIPGTVWERLWYRYAAVSRVAAGEHSPLRDLRRESEWDARTGVRLTAAYVEATAAVDLLRQDIGTAGIIRILELMGRGRSFESAFQDVAGVSAESFEGSVPARLEQLSGPYPNIATWLTGPGDLWFILYGFAPHASVEYAIVGTTSGARWTNRTASVDAFGVWKIFLETHQPADTYTMTATGPPASPDRRATGATVSTTARK